MADPDDKDVVFRQVPIPKAELEVNFATWSVGKPIYRIHSVHYKAIQFNPGKGDARFSPMSNGVPTLYGGANTGVAVMETLFHDLPADSAGEPFDLSKLEGMVHSVMKPAINLNLADLNPRTLRKMGVKRHQLLDSPADQYVFTREYSVAIYQAYPDAHGLQWSSKQHGDTALMLFGDRVRPEHLEVEIESEILLESETVIEVIESEADQLGIVLIEPHGGKEPDDERLFSQTLTYSGLSKG
ncbi:RES family NAD+ phosphorylase [Winslowiella iniecta]|uniref:RES family NAD+ phosphorylase n=1 Tax=Winslowiella iniecta TaxID=1560201 RepID=UPI00069ED693|nr:RES family NAD+ phosphorylase [Winslowiella iniecta]